MTDALGLDTSIAKVRALVAVGSAAAKLLETGELADRLASLERLLEARSDSAPFPTEGLS